MQGRRFDSAADSDGGGPIQRRGDGTYLAVFRKPGRQGYEVFIFVWSGENTESLLRHLADLSLNPEVNFDRGDAIAVAQQIVNAKV